MPPDAVEELLMHAWMETRNSDSVRVLKVVHGFGSSGQGGKTLLVVRNWASRMKGKLRAVIGGEEFSLYNAETQAMRREVGEIDSAELDAGNRGITYLWIK